jgi:hypothetical protein
MWSATPPVGAEMEPNIGASERLPRLMVAVAAGVAAVLAPGVFLKGVCVAGATALLATVATGYCPLNAALDERRGNAPHWRPLRTFRVEP